MAHLREETLNTYLALLLDNYEGIEATAERRSSTEAIDITVVHGTAVAPIPILVEAKIGDTPAKRREAVRQARSRARRLAALARFRPLLSGPPAGRVCFRPSHTERPRRVHHRLRAREALRARADVARRLGRRFRRQSTKRRSVPPACCRHHRIHRPQSSGHAPQLRSRAKSCKSAGSPQEERRSSSRFTRSGTNALQGGTAPPPAATRAVPGWRRQAQDRPGRAHQDPEPSSARHGKRFSLSTFIRSSRPRSPL